MSRESLASTYGLHDQKEGEGRFPGAQDQGILRGVPQRKGTAIAKIYRLAGGKTQQNAQHTGRIVDCTLATSISL